MTLHFVWTGVIGTGSVDWLVLASAIGEAGFLQALGCAFEGTMFRATNGSSAFSRIRLEGAQVRTLLSKGCLLDAELRAFPMGRSARTSCVVSLILRCGQPLAFECIVKPSLSHSLCDWLGDAVAEFLD